MAFVRRIMEDGPRNAILWVDGTDGTALSLVTVDDLGYMDQARLQRAQGLRIDKIEWDIDNADGATPGIVELTWGPAATDPAVPAYHMIGRSNKYFKDFGGLYSPDVTLGDELSISATGTTAYTIIIYLVKLLPNP